MKLAERQKIRAKGLLYKIARKESVILIFWKVNFDIEKAEFYFSRNICYQT